MVSIVQGILRSGQTAPSSVPHASSSARVEVAAPIEGIFEGKDGCVQDWIGFLGQCQHLLNLGSHLTWHMILPLRRSRLLFYSSDWQGSLGIPDRHTHIPALPAHPAQQFTSGRFG